MSRKSLLKHLWLDTEKGRQVCKRCLLVRWEGAHGPRGGKGWSYYRDGGFVSFQTNNATQLKCEPQ